MGSNDCAVDSVIRRMVSSDQECVLQVLTVDTQLLQLNKERSKRFKEGSLRGMNLHLRKNVALAVCG